MCKPRFRYEVCRSGGLRIYSDHQGTLTCPRCTGHGRFCISSPFGCGRHGRDLIPRDLVLSGAKP